MTYEESIRMDNERVWTVDRIMDSLGFHRDKIHQSSRGPAQFTDLIIYSDEDSGDWVSVSFPHEDQCDRGLDISTQAKFNNKIKSPEWNSLHQFQEEVASWIEESRRKERSHG